MKNVMDAIYKLAKSVWKDFGIKNLGEYCNRYMQSITLLLTDLFKISKA